MSEPGTPKKSKEPKYSKFTQQELPSFRPVLEPIWVIFIFGAITIVLIPIGAVCLHYGLKAHEEVVRYDHTCCSGASCASAGWSKMKPEARSTFLRNTNDTLNCNVTITLKQDMPAPVFVYYQLDGFYQNHRRYVKSRDDAQLANTTGGSASECSPQEYLPGTKDMIVPCGLIAWSMFNDTYKFFSSSNGEIVPNAKGIAVKSDVKNRFSNKATFQNYNLAPGAPELVSKNITKYERGGLTATGPLSSNERLIIWMRTAALPRFRKLWGKIEVDLKKGDTITVAIDNHYNTYSFDGKKSIILGTTTWLGGRNPFLGIAYIVTGAISFLMGLVYTVLWQVKGRKTFGNPQDLSATWNRPLGCL